MPISFGSNNSLAYWLEETTCWLTGSCNLIFFNGFSRLRDYCTHLSEMLNVCNIEIILTVRLLRSTACTSCAAGPRPAGGKRTSWGVRPRVLGPTRSTRTACQSNPCSRHSWKKPEMRRNVQRLVVMRLHGIRYGTHLLKDHLTHTNKDDYCEYFHSTAAESR